MLRDFWGLDRKGKLVLNIKHSTESVWCVLHINAKYGKMPIFDSIAMLKVFWQMRC